MKKNILLSLAFLLVFVFSGLKSEGTQAAAGAAADFSEFEELGDVDMSSIRELESTEPKFKETWKIRWLGIQAWMEGYKLEAEEKISKHKLVCGSIATVIVLTIITYLLSKKNNTGKH